MKGGNVVMREKEERASIEKGGEGVIEFCMMSFLAEELLLVGADTIKEIWIAPECDRPVLALEKAGTDFLNFEPKNRHYC